MDTFFASILDAVSVLDVVKMFDVVNTFEFYFVKIKTITYCVLILLSLPRVIFSIYITASYSRKIANDQKVGIVFAIITLIFVNRISGILILCDSSK